MTKLTCMFVAAVSLAAVGCKKKGGDCTAAINHSMELSKADMAKMGADDAMMQKMKDLGIQHCKDDKWSGDVLKCMTDAKTMTDSQACYGKLSRDQQDKMNKAAMELTPPPAAGSAEGSAVPEAGSAAAGSDTGSAPAGSAGSAEGSAAK
jgi:hypothetical protein